MKKFLVPALIAFLSVATFAGQANAQDSGMSAEKRDALIGRLESVLQELQNERAAANQIDTSDFKVVEGSLSADSLPTSIGSYSSIGSYGGSGTRNDGGAYSVADASLPVVEQSYSYGSLPLVQANPVFAAAPIVEPAPLTFAAPVLQAAPVQQAPIVTSIGPLPDITLPTINITEPAPAPTIIVQQAPPVNTFQPVFMNFIAPTPLPAPLPRRHKCCLFGR